MNLKTLKTVLCALSFMAGFGQAPLLAVDGSWTLTAGGSQDYGNTANWLNTIMADGPDAAAIFSVNLGSDQTITNIGSRTVGHIFFQDTDASSSSQGGYALGSATLDASPFTLDVSSGRSVIDVGSLYSSGGKKVSLSSPMANADGILKINFGQFSIRANSPGLTSDYVAAGGLTDTRSFLTGLTNLLVLGGAQFQVDFGNAPANSNNLLSNTIPVTLGGTTLVPNPAIPPFLPLTFNNTLSGGGTLTVSGRSTSTNTQIVGSVTLNRGTHTISVSTGTAPSSTLFDPTVFIRNAGAVVNFSSAGTPGTNMLKAGGLVNDANGIIGGWAIDGSNWATVAGDIIAPLTAYETNADPAIWTAATNVSLATSALAPIGTRTINTLRLAGNSTNSIGAGNTLTLSDGGLLASAGISQLRDGTLLGPPGGELVLYANTTNVITSVIADNTSASTLIKSGTGILMLGGNNANTYSGGTFVNQGTLQVGDGLGGINGAALGTGSVTLFGSVIVNATNDITIANNFSGSGLLVKQGPNTLTLSGNNTHNGFNTTAPGNVASGAGQSLAYAGTRLDSGTLAVASDTALGGVFRFHLANTTLRSADTSTRTLANSVDVASSPVIMGTPSSGNLIFTGPLDTGNGSKAFVISNALTRFDGPIKQGGGPGTATLTKSGPGTLVLNAATNLITKPFWVTAGTLRIASENMLGSVPTFVPTQLTLSNGTLQTTATISMSDANRGITLGGMGTFNVDAGTTLTIPQAMVGSGGLGKSGGGTLVLSGYNVYPGPTLISGGSLILNASGSIGSSSSVIVGPGATLDVSAFSPFTLAAGQTLGGSGNVLGSVTGSGSSVVSPGTTTTGTLTLNNDLTLAAGDGLILDLTNNTTMGGGVNDLLVVNGNLNLDNNVLTIRPVAPGGALATGTYRLVNYTGTKTGSLSINPGSRYTFTLDESTPGQINLIVSGGAANLTWSGTLNSSWDVGATPNWLNGAIPDAFFNFDSVTFNDTALNFNVSVETTVVPTALFVNANSNYTFGGIGTISGTTSLRKSGTGTLILGNFGVNDYSGGTYITNGTLQVGQNDGSGTIGSGPILNNGVLEIRNASFPVTIANMSGTGALYANGASQPVILTVGNTYSGPTSIGTGGKVSLIAGSSALDSLGTSPSISVQGGGTFYTEVPGNYGQALILNGSGDGTGALHVGNNNAAWLGPITLGSDSAIGNEGGTLLISNTITGGTFALTKAGAGTVILGANAIYGNTAVAAGTLQVGNGGTVGNLGSGPVANDRLLAINRSDDVVIANSISGTGGLLKSGANTVTLSGNNTYDGSNSGFAAGAPGTPATRLDGGTLALGSDTALGTGVFRAHNSGVIVRATDSNPRIVPNAVDVAVDFTIGSATTGDLNWTGAIWCGGGAKAFTISNHVTTFSGVVNGSTNNNNITKAGPGTLVLTAVNTYGRPTVVNGGVLLVTGEITSTNTVTVNAATLGGTGLIYGPVVVQSAGTLSPGVAGIGTLTISNTLSLSGTNFVEINKSSGTYDVVRGLTSVTYGGTLNVSLLAGAFAAGDSFKLFEAGTYNGGFSAIVPATPGLGLAWDAGSLTTDGRLKVVTGATTVSPTLGYSLSGNQLTLTWPADHIGWRLEAQNNTVSVGLSNNWFTVPNSTTTNQVDITVNPATGAAFFRLVSP